MKNKLLSIIIPSYNVEKYIGDCLNSIIPLMSDDIEVLVINDGSKDNTAEIVNSFISKDDRIRLINVQNGGVSKARNTGIEYSCGEYLMFLDADDCLLEEAFNLIRENINSRKYDFTAFSRTILEEDGRRWNQLFNKNGIDVTEKKLVDGFMFADSLLNECWGKLYKKDIINIHNIRFKVDIPIGEDVMFVMEYYSHCDNVHIYNIPLVLYRQHGESTMRKYNISDRIAYTEGLFEYAKKYVPSTMSSQIHYYNFKILTNLCREYSRKRVNKEAIRIVYHSYMTAEILSKLSLKSIPNYKKPEYVLMKYKFLSVSAVYYYFKEIISDYSK